MTERQKDKKTREEIQKKEKTERQGIRIELTRHPDSLQRTTQIEKGWGGAGSFIKHSWKRRKE